MNLDDKNFDFLRIVESTLEQEWNQLENSTEDFYSNIQKLRDEMNETFKSCDVSICEKTTPFVCRDPPVENSKELLEELTELHKRHESFQKDLEALRTVPLKDLDIEVLGRPNKEQKIIFLQRIIQNAKTRTVNRKIVKKLLEELNFYQDKIEPYVQQKVLANQICRLQEQEQKIETQMNNEVQRIEKAFFKIFIQSTKTKRKYERVDWRLRTEMFPKITKLTVKLFDTKEKLKKVESEIQDLKNRNEKQLKIDDDLEEALETLEEEFRVLLEDMKNGESEVKHLKSQIKLTAEKTAEVKKKFLSSLEDSNLNNLISQRINEIHADNLDFDHHDSHCSTHKKFTQQTCTIAELANAIWVTSTKIREAKIQISKLTQDVDHLLQRGSEEIIGRDYLGSFFAHHTENKSDNKV